MFRFCLLFFLYVAVLIAAVAVAVAVASAAAAPTVADILLFESVESSDHALNLCFALNLCLSLFFFPFFSLCVCVCVCACVWVCLRFYGHVGTYRYLTMAISQSLGGS